MTPKPAQPSSQWLRGVLDLCLLAVVEHKPAYGYEMTTRLTEAGLGVVADGSIYPALGRLERDGLVTSFRVPSEGGPPRKYYEISTPGRKALERGRRNWAEFVTGVAGVLHPEPTTKKR